MPNRTAAGSTDFRYRSHGGWQYGVFTKTLIDKDGNEIPFDDTLPIPDGMEAPEGYQLVAVETGVSDANNTEIFWGVDEGATVYLNATPNTSNAVTDEENAAYNG